MKSHLLQERSVLIIVDVQNGFLPGGNLAVAGADRIIPIVNQLASQFQNIVLTQDWHPPMHQSFATAHTGHQPYDVIEMPYGPQVLWPEHCVQGTHDAAISSELKIDHAQLIIRKGYMSHVDSYSAFMEADRVNQTGLAGYLTERGISHCYICGLATDFCVAYTAIDACAKGFTTTVIEDACQGINLNGSLKNAWQQMQAAGVERIQSTDLVI